MEYERYIPNNGEWGRPSGLGRWSRPFVRRVILLFTIIVMVSFGVGGVGLVSSGSSSFATYTLHIAVSFCESTESALIFSASRPEFEAAMDNCTGEVTPDRLALEISYGADGSNRIPYVGDSAFALTQPLPVDEVMSIQVFDPRTGVRAVYPLRPDSDQVTLNLLVTNAARLTIPATDVVSMRVRVVECVGDSAHLGFVTTEQAGAACNPGAVSEPGNLMPRFSNGSLSLISYVGVEGVYDITTELRDDRLLTVTAFERATRRTTVHVLWPWLGLNEVTLVIVHEEPR